MKVTAILKGRKDQNGQLPIQIRVSIGTQRRFFPTKMRVLKTQFSKGRVKDHPKAASYNEEIKRLIVLHQAANIDGLKRREKKVDFYQYLQDCIDEWEQYRAPGTMRIYKSLGELIREFRPQLYLHEIDLKFLKEWKAYRLRQKKSENTLHTNFTKLKAVINKALEEGKITADPFKGFDFPAYTDPEKVYLAKEELQQFEKVLPEVGALSFYGYWFLIACHTGLRVSDILAFNAKKHITGGRIIVTTKKTKDIVSIPLTDKLRAYFEAIEYRPLDCVEETYRGKIKAIALAAGIKKSISTHTARHTAAVLMATAGISQEVVAKILGQKDLRSTRVYYKIINTRIDSDYDRFMSSL